MAAYLEGGAQPYDVVIFSNGPGELATWVRPVVLELRERIPQARISLILSPCPHASGQEVMMAQEYVGVDRVQDADFFLTFLLTGQTEESWEWAPRGVVVFLGGDQFFTILAGYRLGFRSIIYVEQEPRWRIFANVFAVRNEAIKQRYDGGWLWQHRWRTKMQVVGDLMVDGVASATYLPGLPILGWSATGSYGEALLPRSKSTPPKIIVDDLDSSLDVTTLPEEVPTTTPDAALLPRGWQRLTEKGRTHFQIGLLPGSKPAKLSLGVPMVLAIADELRQLLPNVSFVLPVAPTQTAKSLASYAQPKTNRDMGLVYGTSGILEQTNLGSQFVTPYGTIVNLWTTFPAYSVLANCDLCITTVGANTAELACLGVPMVVVIPLNKLEAMRAWDGLLGLLVNLPIIGTLLAKAVNWIAHQRFLGLLAWPNIWAGEEVVKEMRGHLRPVQIAEYSRDLLEDPQKRQQISHRLRSLGGEPGAAQAIVKLISGQLAKARSRFRKARSR
ncbi:MAG: hypothetical protein NW237_07245 [Cyanobacteriota bacterium]|nr:hypothetical protein [Cyanobacteriota bacterium]